MNKHNRSTDEYDEEDDDYLAKVPTRFQKVVQKPKDSAQRWPEEWD